MKLFISYVNASTTAETIESNFRDTFGAEVLVRFSSPKSSSKSAFVELTESSSEMNRFIQQIRLHGFNSFYANKIEYIVRLDSTSTPTPRPTFVPRIV